MRRAIGWGSWAGERRGEGLDFEAVAHVIQNRVEAAYARSDLFEQRRKLMDSGAAYLNGPPQSDTHTVAYPEL